MSSQAQPQVKKSWQERQKEKELSSAKAEKGKAAKKIGYWVLAAAAVFTLGWWYVSASFPKEPDLSWAVPVLGRDHIPDGAKFGGYNSNPPTSGPHYSEPANAGFYTAELPDERVVHNLEHGNVWISYKPDLPREAIDVLKSFAGGEIIVTPRAANDKDVALAAWGRLDKFNLGGNPPDKQRIRDFILRYENQGPEKIPVSEHVK